VEIRSLRELLKWAREPYPDRYSQDWRKETGAPCGREAMRELWARYLRWREDALAAA
jgi:hypothetical protein